MSAGWLVNSVAPEIKSLLTLALVTASSVILAVVTAVSASWVVPTEPLPTVVKVIALSARIKSIES